MWTFDLFEMVFARNDCPEMVTYLQIGDKWAYDMNIFQNEI